jgi:cadmium resistance protein CadD (predicted permease)
VVIVEVIGLGIVAFVATNIDDLFILMIFFAKRSFPNYRLSLANMLEWGCYPD